LTNNSLNERQKSKIVEALSNAGSINDAKVIFETLESAVGSVTGKARPQSLRETIERPTATLPRREAKKATLSRNGQNANFGWHKKIKII
jgi:3-dehydroquinate synthase class II